MTLNKSNTTLNTQAVLSMKSSGYYSQRTAGAKIAIDSIQPLMEKAIIEIPKLPILRMADFGSADGGTSQAMWSKLINIIRKGNDNRHIEILYTDLASNDFSTLFKTMQGMQGNSKISFQKQFPNIFVHSCGTGFHKQLLSSNSLSLGFSATAMHYISEKPCQINNHVHMVGADLIEKEKFAKQALKDWESILLSRSKELTKGGRFICLNFGIDEKGRYLGHTGGHSMFDKFTYHWKSLLNKGIITEKEFKAQGLGCSETYLRARNLLIEVGLIKLQHRGGMTRGDRAKYRLLFVKGVFLEHQRWTRYPRENWKNEILH